MNIFEEASLRLKQQLKVTEDKQVAQFLGLTADAWVKRKNRDAFPEKEVYALAAKRPELKLDVIYVLTGEKSSDWQREQFALTSKTIFEMDPNSDGAMHQSLLDSVKTVGMKKRGRQPDFDRLKEVLSNHDDDEYKMVMDLAFMLASDLRSLRAKRAGVSVKKSGKKAV